MPKERRDSIGRRIGKRARPKKGDGRGNPPYEVNDLHRGMVVAFTVSGYTLEGVAAKVGIHVQTLKKYYSVELEESMREWEFRAINIILMAIKKGDLGAAKYLLERRTKNWGENSDQGVTALRSLPKSPDLVAADVANNIRKRHAKEKSKKSKNVNKS